MENISGNFFDKLIIFNNHEIIMHNDVFNTSSSFYIQNNQWTSFNEYFVDIYACEKKGTRKYLFFKIGEEDYLTV